MEAFYICLYIYIHRSQNEDDYYYDETAVNNIEYCYTIEAVYDLGNSVLSNPSCTMWEILPPSGLLAEGNDGMVHLEWSEPTTSACADEIIPALPFNAFGSNVGAGDEWLVQGSQGADYTYRLSISTPTVIDISVCSANTTYDTKLEVFDSGLYGGSKYTSVFPSIQSIAEL